MSIDRERLVQTFMDLVRIDSETGNERKMADELIARFAGLGLTLEEDHTQEATGCGSGNLYLYMEGAVDGAPGIFFSAHIDTVSPGRSVKPQVGEDGIIRSDGTTILGSDDKAGVSAILEAVRVIQESDVPRGPIEMILTVGEEDGLRGAKAFDKSRIRSSCGFVLDAGGPVGKAAVCESGRAVLNIHIHGKSGHAAFPESGISAIEVASKAISRIPLGRVDAETVANIGEIAGGTGTNVIAGQVQIAAEARSLNEEKLRAQVERMTSAFRLAAEEAQAKVDIDVQVSHMPYRHQEQDRVLKLAAEAFRRIGRTPNFQDNMGCSDANIFNDYGIPTVKLSVGYEQIHSTSEWIPVSELEKTAELILGLVSAAAEEGRIGNGEQS